MKKEINRQKNITLLTWTEKLINSGVLICQEEKGGVQQNVLQKNSVTLGDYRADCDSLVYRISSVGTS